MKRIELAAEDDSHEKGVITLQFRDVNHAFTSLTAAHASHYRAAQVAFKRQDFSAVNLHYEYCKAYFKSLNTLTITDEIN